MYLFIFASGELTLSPETLFHKINFDRLLVIGRETQLPSNIKLHSSKDDRGQLNRVFEELLSDSTLLEKLSGLKIKYLPTISEKNGTLYKNFKAALKFFKEQDEQGGRERIKDIYESLLNSLSVVQIDVMDPTNGPKIFDSLNSQQEPMTIGDLVRNEIFSRVADQHPNDIESLDHQYWQPFYKKFQQNGQNLFDAYFFPYGLIQDPNTRKSEVYSNLRNSWVKIWDPEKIIRALAKYQDAFIDIDCGTNLQKHPKNIAMGFKNIFEANNPTATYPFMMQLSNAIKEKTVGEDIALNILELLESFLVRRAVCGYEPTGLHAVFKRLWADCDGNLTHENVKKQIKSHKTVSWPGKDEVERSIKFRPLYGAGITRFLLLEYDKSLKGDHPQDIPWIEHVLPQNPDPEWFNYFTKDQHEKSVDLIANLIPLSEKMNIEVSNKPFKNKKIKFVNDSMFKSARTFAKIYTEWNPKNLAQRADILAEWAVKRWRH